MTHTQTERPVAVVTGSSVGLGKSIAQAFLGAGYRVALTGFRADSASEAARDLDPSGEHAAGFSQDIRSEESFVELLRSVESTLGAPSVLVNNAGRTLFGKPLEISAEDFNEGLQLNLTGAFLGCKVFGAYFADRGYGRIVNIASLAAQNGGTASGIHYASAKGGMLTMTKVFARELAPHGVTVNAIAPGPLEGAVVRESVPADKLEQIISNIPVRTLLSSDFVGQTAVLLASPDALSVTGACWDINGGLNLR